MTAEEDEAETKAAAASAHAGPESTGAAGRRNFMKAGLALSILLLIGGIASVAKSVLAPPANPPTPEAQTSTVTKLSTVTSTVTTTSTEVASPASESSSSSAQSSSSSTSTSESTSQSSSTSTTTTTTAPSTSSTSSSPFPVVFVANVSDLEVSQPIEFNYPLEETPNILVKLGVKATGGVGPDGDIVAFSQICQHLGCIWAYVPPKSSPACDPTYTSPLPSGYCCCHGTTYDLTAAGDVTGGPAPRPIPEVTLMVDSSGDIYAVGMGPPTIFGHNTGSDNVLYDLQGGTLVSGT